LLLAERPTILESDKVEGKLTVVLSLAVELGTEAIPGCVLQMYTWLTNRDELGVSALVIIGVSALTTRYISAMISFDMDVDMPHRKNQPKFYGYLPVDHGARGLCFILMTLISALHNISRSAGSALLLASSYGKRLWVIATGCEMALFIVYKVARKDFPWWPRIESTGIAILTATVARFMTKVVTDFR